METVSNLSSSHLYSVHLYGISKCILMWRTNRKYCSCFRYTTSCWTTSYQSEAEKETSVIRTLSSRSSQDSLQSPKLSDHKGTKTIRLRTGHERPTSQGLVPKQENTVEEKDCTTRRTLHPATLLERPDQPHITSASPWQPSSDVTTRLPKLPSSYATKNWAIPTRITWP